MLHLIAYCHLLHVAYSLHRPAFHYKIYHSLCKFHEPKILTRFLFDCVSSSATTRLSSQGTGQVNFLTAKNLVEKIVTKPTILLPKATIRYLSNEQAKRIYSADIENTLRRKNRKKKEAEEEQLRKLPVLKVITNRKSSCWTNACCHRWNWRGISNGMPRSEKVGELFVDCCVLLIAYCLLFIVSFLFGLMSWE